MSARPTQQGRFDLTTVLFHTLFNRTVENFHTRFIFAQIFYLQLVLELQREAKIFSGNDRESKIFMLEILLEASASRLSRAAPACYDFCLPQITRTK
jgi:hypothetical protein